MTYLATVLADAPLHYWRLADGGGGIAHDIGSTPWHLMCGGTVPNSEGPLGYSGPNSDGGAAWFPSGAEIASNSQAIQTVNSPWTMEIWHWHFANPGAQLVMFGWPNTGGQAIAVQANIQTDGFVGGSFAVLGPALARQVWHHALLSYDGTTIRVYEDGVLQSAVAKAGPVNVSAIVGIGSDPTTFGTSFTGFLSEAAIYGTALSAARAAAHYAAADQPLQSPVYIAVAGNQSVSGVNSGSAAAGTQSIVNSLTRAWQNAP